MVSISGVPDLPFILSGERIGVIDPHQNFFPTSSYAWNLSKRHDLLEHFPHQFQPFLGLFDCTEECFSEGFYNGTVFRFPLRKQPSHLCDTLYTSERVQNLIQSFKQDSHLLLLFLRHVESVEIYERDAQSLTPKRRYSVRISDDCLYDIRQKRTEFLNQAQRSSRYERALVSTYPIELECRDFDGSSEEITRFKWLVTNYYCGNQMSAVFRRLHKDTDLNFLPWVGVAMPLDPPSDEKNIYSLSKDDGHIFCFLPLPEEGRTTSGLPVHLNGCFALEQNRKYIKWPSTGYQTREELMDKRLLWNQCLLREAIPKAYMNLLLAAIDRHKKGEDPSVTVEIIYRAFPDFRKVDRKWDPVLPPMYSELVRNHVVYTSARGGQWIEPRNAVFNTLDDAHEAKSVITEILDSSEAKLADVPAHVMHSIQTCCALIIGKVTPQIVSAAYRQVQNAISIEWANRIKLLRYFLKEQKYDLLDGLELLPLANGGFQVFYCNPRRADRFIYIPSGNIPSELLPGGEDDLLDTEIDHDIQEMLLKASNRGTKHWRFRINTR